jgi:hypothetical protein
MRLGRMGLLIISHVHTKRIVFCDSNKLHRARREEQEKKKKKSEINTVTPLQP